MAQSRRAVTTTATVTATAATIPTGTPPVCVPQFDCSSSPKTDAGCQAKPPSRFSLLGNENMVCNKKPEVFHNAFVSCPVRAPELSGLFPGDHVLTIDLNPVNKSIHGQLWLNKAQQFFCQMPDCTVATTDDGGVISTKWECPVLQCSCIEPSLMCGGIPGPPLSLKGAINGLKGPFALSCPHNSKDCDFFIDDLKGFFPTGLKLADCDTGECVYPSEMQSSLTAVRNTLAPGVIASLGILGAIIALLVVVCVRARRSQLALMRLPYTINTDAASLQFRDVGYTLNKDGLEILKGISGAASAGVVLAVMGPSGSGKSTLVDILAGKRKDGKVTGQILLNGKQVHESEIRHAVGFVDQEDTLAATQTVYEAVLFSAMLRLPEAMPILRIHERVAEVIEMLGLTHCKDRRIGNVTSRGISGGEKRRVSIALELITRPPILILDEPTSGLDSYSAHMVVEQLCKLAASKTTTVIMTIHQPRSDIFFMFDQTLVISKGEALYFGPTEGAAEYLHQRGLHCPSNYNIADYLLDIAMDPELLAKAKAFDGQDGREKSGHSTAHQLHQEANNVISRRAGSAHDQRNGIVDTDAGTTSPKSHTSNETAVSIDEGGSTGHPLKAAPECKPGSRQKTIYPTSFLTQLRVIMKRDFQTLIRDRSLLVLHLAVAIILGIFIGGLYFQVPTTLAGFQNRAGSLFFMLALLGFSSISALGAFTETRTLFVKERSNGYYPPMPFIISTLLFDLIPLRILPSLFLGCISYFMIGLSPVVQTFLKFLLILVLFNVATALFCLVIAAGVRTTGIASLASSIVMLFMMLFGGFMINSGKIPAALTWIQYLSMFKYGFEALAVNEVATTTLSDNIQGVAFNVPGSLILQKLFGFDLGGYWRNMIIMVGFIVLFIATFWSLVSLRLKERK
ncbi:hypothetical protein EC968_003752 [Mortierella alpina]|nr:hypothetical protein EC968_003752 [Mortierella alpina]